MGVGGGWGGGGGNQTYTKIMYLAIPTGITMAQAMKTVDVANYCLKEVGNHAGDSHWYSFNVKHLNSSTH